MSGTEWSLHPSVFRALIREWGSHYWICLQQGGITNFHYLCHVPCSRSISHGSRCSVSEVRSIEIRPISSYLRGEYPGLKSLLRNIKMERAPSTSFSRVESRLSFVSITLLHAITNQKPPLGGSSSATMSKANNVNEDETQHLTELFQGHECL